MAIAYLNPASATTNTSWNSSNLSHLAQGQTSNNWTTTGNGANLSGIGQVDKSVTKNPPTPIEYGRKHLSPANIGTVS